MGRAMDEYERKLARFHEEHGDTTVSKDQLMGSPRTSRDGGVALVVSCPCGREITLPVWGLETRQVEFSFPDGWAIQVGERPGRYPPGLDDPAQTLVRCPKHRAESLPVLP